MFFLENLSYNFKLKKDSIKLAKPVKSYIFYDDIAILIEFIIIFVGAQSITTLRNLIKFRIFLFCNIKLLFIYAPLSR